MKKRTSYIIIFSIIVVGIVLDLVSKHFFALRFEANSQKIVVIPNLFEFVFVKNTGAAYGIFGDSTVMLSVVSILFIIGFVLFDIFNHKNDWLYIFGIGLILSGAIGNLVDRLFLGYVRDFISIKLFSFVFNLADLFITAGVICFLVYLLISLIKEKKEKSNGMGNK
ncbi:MAG TPA: signal peptidase II [Clostridiales bacterium]|nr:signal peptidase II [Clostridiales bacterium]